MLTSLIFLSCSKSNDEEDIKAPVITIDNPLNNQIFSAGQSIPIKGSITDDNYIAEVHIHITNTNTGTLLMDVHKFPAASTVTFNESITAVAGVNYKIQVVTTDKEVNEGRASVLVSCN